MIIALKNKNGNLDVDETSSTVGEMPPGGGSSVYMDITGPVSVHAATRCSV